MNFRMLRALAFGLLMIAEMSVCLSAQATQKLLASASPYRGGLVNPPLPKPEFMLTDTSGKNYDFSARTRGSITLLFFGYTHCADMCPMQMATIAKALHRLPPDVAEQFKVVFVTTDPDRDTPQVLRAWLDHFDKRFIGLTGSQQAIDAAETAARLPIAKKYAPNADGDYSVDHAAFVLAYSKDNFAHVIYPVGVEQDDWSHDLPYLAQDDWKSH